MFLSQRLDKTLDVCYNGHISQLRTHDRIDNTMAQNAVRGGGDGAMKKKHRNKRAVDLWGILFYVFGVISGTAIIVMLKAGGIL